MTQFAGVALAAVLNTLWQTAAIAAVVWVVCKLLPGMNAATRYAAWSAVLLSVVMFPLLTITTQGEADPMLQVSSAFVVATPQEDAVPEVAVLPWTPEPSAPGPSLPVTLSSGIWLWVALAVWATLAFFRLGQIAWSYRYLRGVKRRATRASAEHALQFQGWLDSCRIRRPVRLLVSREITSPMAVGFLHPAVIMPETLLGELAGTELDHVLLHEMAHLGRRDDWTNLGFRLAGAFLALHPVAAWALLRIEQEREIACDDWVVAMTGAAKPYAASLARLFELCFVRRRQVLASGMADRASHLGERIERLVRRGRDVAPGVSLTGVALGAGILLALVAAVSRTPPWIAFEQEAFAQEPFDSVPPAPPNSPLPPEPPKAILPPFVFATQAPPLPPLPPAPQRHSFLGALVASGYGDLSVDEIIELRQTGVSPEFLNEIAQSGWGKLPPRKLIELSTHGVSASYLRRMKEAGLKNLTLDETLEMASHGVQPDYLREIHSLGFGPYTAGQAIQLAQSGVQTAFFRGLREAGYMNLEPSDIIEGAMAGIRPSDLRAAKQFGTGLTWKQIIRLKQAGVI